MCNLLTMGLYTYNMLPMGLKIASDVFQEVMGELFPDMENIIAYVDDILMVGTGTFEEHLVIIEEVLKRIDEQRMQVNAEKSAWKRPEVEYLGFVITHERIKPQHKKVQGILDMKEPASTKQVRSLASMVNYYKPLWPMMRKIIFPRISYR